MDPSTLLIPGPAGNLETLVYVPEKMPPTRGAVVLHPNPLYGGTNRNKVVETIAKTLLAKNYVVYLPNLRGVGKSGGKHDFGGGEVEDVKAVLAHLSRRYPHLPQTLAGFSFGAYVALKTGLELAFSQLILVGAAVGKYEERTPKLPAGTHALLIHGEEDEIIPLSTVLTWAGEQNLPVTVIPGSSHFFHGKLAVLRQIVTDFAA